MRACIAVCLWFFFVFAVAIVFRQRRRRLRYIGVIKAYTMKRERLDSQFGLCGTKHTHVFTCISNKSHNTSTGGSNNGDGKALGPFYVLESKSAANAWEWNNNNNKCQKLRTTTKETKTRKKHHIYKRNPALYSRARSQHLHTPFGRRPSHSARHPVYNTNIISFFVILFIHYSPVCSS